jgi:diguanylate cyclase (GGDEF)-like protein
VDEESLEVVLMLQRPASAAVVEEAKARLLEAILKERQGVGFNRIQARLFTPGATARGTEEGALMGFAAFPITTNGRLTGLLALGGKAATRISGDTEAFMAQVANQAQIVVENSRLFERVRNLSIRDGLTDLYNHRHTMELLTNEFERVGRYQEGVSLLMIDIDHFKKVNDRYGHPAGDVVLRGVAHILKDSLRTVDAVGRYGGEEFVAILPHTGQEEAQGTAERLRRAVELHTFKVGDRELHVTVSVGLATFPSATVESPNALIREADKALYRAKEAGRNRIA